MSLYWRHGVRRGIRPSCDVRWSETSTPRLWRMTVRGKRYELNQVWAGQHRFFLAENNREIGEFKSRRDATAAVRQRVCK